MAGASLIEAEVVTADGEVRIANACTEPGPLLGAEGRRRRFRRRHPRDPAHACAPETSAASFATIRATSDDACPPPGRQDVDFYARRFSIRTGASRSASARAASLDPDGLPGARPAGGRGALAPVLRLGRVAAGLRDHFGAADRRVAGHAVLGPIAAHSVPGLVLSDDRGARRGTIYSGPEILEEAGAV